MIEEKALAPVNRGNPDQPHEEASAKVNLRELTRQVEAEMARLDQLTNAENPAVTIILTEEQAEALEYALYAQDVTDVVIQTGTMTMILSINDDDTISGKGDFDP